MSWLTDRVRAPHTHGAFTAYTTFKTYTISSPRASPLRRLSTRRPCATLSVLRWAQARRHRGGCIAARFTSAKRAARPRLARRRRGADSGRRLWYAGLPPARSGIPSGGWSGHAAKHPIQTRGARTIRAGTSACALVIRPLW